MSDWQSVVSSNIAAVKYDDQTNTLAIRFTSGGVYEYNKVPPDEFENLVNAASVGSYFSNNIRGLYPEQRVG